MRMMVELVASQYRSGRATYAAARIRKDMPFPLYLGSSISTTCMLYLALKQVRRNRSAAQRPE